MGAAWSCHVGITIPSTITNGELTIQDEIVGTKPRSVTFPKGAGPCSSYQSYAGGSPKAKLCSRRRHGRSSRLSKASLRLLQAMTGRPYVPLGCVVSDRARPSVSSSVFAGRDSSSELDQPTSQGDFASALWNRARKNGSQSARTTVIKPGHGALQGNRAVQQQGGSDGIMSSTQPRCVIPEVLDQEA
jgi:hypothetical protein